MKISPIPWEWGAENETIQDGTPLKDSNGNLVMVVCESHGGGMMPNSNNKMLFENGFLSI